MMSCVFFLVVELLEAKSCNVGQCIHFLTLTLVRRAINQVKKKFHKLFPVYLFFKRYSQQNQTIILKLRLFFKSRIKVVIGIV